MQQSGGGSRNDGAASANKLTVAWRLSATHRSIRFLAGCVMFVLLLAIGVHPATAAICGNGIQEPGEECDKNSMGTFDDCCDPSTCTLKVAGTTCRPAHTYGNCDPGGECSGTYSFCGYLPVAPGKCTGGSCCDNNTCDLLAAGTSCNACGDTCDGSNDYCGAPDKCSNGGCCDATCHVKAPGTVCRPAAGICDAAEVCTGGWDCPEDVGGPSGGECRASTGACDPAEICSGSAVCGVDVNQCSATGTGPFAYLPNLADGSVGVVDIATRTFWASIPVGRLSDGVAGVAVSSNGSRVYVGTSSGVSVIDTSTNTAVAAGVGGRKSFSAVVTPDGQKVYVTNPEDKAVSVISATSNTLITTISLPAAPQPVGIALAAGKAYVGNFGAGVSVINTTTDSLTTTIPLAATAFAGDVVALPDGSKVYVSDPNNGSVLVVDPAIDAVTTRISTGAFASALAATADGAEVYVTNAGAGTVSVIDSATDTVTATVVVANPSSGNGDGPPMGPSGVEVTPDGKEVWVVVSGSNDVVVIDAATHAIIPSRGFHVGTEGFVLGNFMQLAGGRPTRPPTATPTAVQPTPPPSTTRLPTATAIPFPDRDGDGVSDATDNCPDSWNPAQSDMDNDNIGDMCQPDFADTPFVLRQVNLKAAGTTRDGYATIVLKGMLDTTEWGGATAFAGVLRQGFAVHVDGAGLAVPGETTNFAPCSSVCLGSGPAVATFAKKNRKTPNLLTVKVTMKGRTFPPPLSSGEVAVTLSLGARDRRDWIGSCTIRGLSSTAQCRVPRGR